MRWWVRGGGLRETWGFGEGVGVVGGGGEGGVLVGGAGCGDGLVIHAKFNFIISLILVKAQPQQLTLQQVQLHHLSTQPFEMALLILCG